MSRGHDDKICSSCGRRFAWRRKWARDWEQVRYCSNACRRRGIDAADRDCESFLIAAVSAGRGRPVELGELAGARDEPERFRRAARRLAHQGRIELLQQGRVVDPAEIRGPVDARLAT